MDVVPVFKFSESSESFDSILQVGSDSLSQLIFGDSSGQLIPNSRHSFSAWVSIKQLYPSARVCACQSISLPVSGVVFTPVFSWFIDQVYGW